MQKRILFAAVGFIVACSRRAPAPRDGPSSSPAHHVDGATSEPAGRLHFIDDDVPAAMARARSEHKALFVDAWATWCHTCLSMRNFVLDDPSLRGLANTVVFASLDTDRPQNADFLERHPIRIWPSYFVIDPTNDHVLGYLSGSASVQDFRSFVEDSLRGLDARTDAGDTRSAAESALSEARAAHAAGDWSAAAAAYSRAISAAPSDWPRRSATLYAWMSVLYELRDWNECLRVGRAQINNVADLSDTDGFSWYLLECTARLPNDNDATLTRISIAARLRDVLARSDGEPSADDRASAMETLAEDLVAMADTAGARMTREAIVTLLERAAHQAPSTLIASTFDEGRVRAYVSLGRADDALRLLNEREREFPTSADPPAHLASVLISLGRWTEARAAADRALSHAYGPRRLRLLKLRAEILGQLGDRQGQLAALREEVSGYEALPNGQASPDARIDAEHRLSAAERAANGEP